MTPWRTPSRSAPPTATSFAGSSRIPAEQLRSVREPLRWRLDLGSRAPVHETLALLRRAALGPYEASWTPPDFLLPHQVAAARRLAAGLQVFRGSVLADSVGLGKTYVALAVATRYPTAAVLAPAALVPQWRRVMEVVGVRLPLASHEALSRGAHPPRADLIVVDEAHRFRNPATIRHELLARAAAQAHLLLVTATPVVNGMADIVHLVRLFLPDHGLAAQGVPSLEHVLASRAFEPLAHALSALVVARSPAAIRDALPALPSVMDARVLVRPPLPAGAVDSLVQAIDALQFPTFADRQAAELLRLHLCYRLASSADALAASLRHHRAYLEHAIAAARRGQPLSRGACRALLGVEDDLQLELECLSPASPHELDVSAMEAERSRIEGLATLLQSRRATDPKADALASVLAGCSGQKTLVFTAAVATATYLARRLHWRRVGVATGRGARVASGPISLEEALSCFAPRARGAPGPPEALALHTLIATDLVSEGLDLQDAAAVIHYDLPWTPLRLEQRVGRLVRLGSPHAAVGVWWFRPVRQLEARLTLARRLAAKVTTQLRLGVATSSGVGRARVFGGLFDWRQRFGAGDQPLPDESRFAVVGAPQAAAFVLQWTLGICRFRELLVIEGDPPDEVQDETGVARVVEYLSAATPSLEPPPRVLCDALHQVLRRRLADCMRGPCDEETRRLARRLLRLARLAGRRRDRGLLGVVDEALDRLAAGVTSAPARQLERALSGHCPYADLRRWLSETPATRAMCPLVTLEAALLGDGSLERRRVGRRVYSAHRQRPEQPTRVRDKGGGP